MSQIEKRIQTPDTSDLVTESPALVKYLKNLNESLMKYSIKIGDIFNKGFKIEDNFNANIVEVNFPIANSEVSITHTLNRIPKGFLALNINKAATIYDSGTTWTISEIYVKASTAATTAKLLIL